MKYLRAFGIKFIFTTVIVFSLFGIFYHTSLFTLLMLSVAVTGITYLGDVFLLPRLGNIIAPILDFMGIFVLLWFLGNTFIQTSTSMTITSLAAAYVLAICEAIFHIYMREGIFEEPEKMPTFNQLQTEFGEEMDPDIVTKKGAENRQTDVDQ